MAAISRAIITGASSGVGSVLARRLSKKSGQVSLLSLHLCGRNKDNLERVATECREIGAPDLHVSTSCGDVGVSEDVNRMWKEYKLSHQSDDVDLIVLNAGVNRVGAVENISLSDFNTVLKTNLWGVWLWLTKVIPVMKRNFKGQIVVTNSVRGLAGGANSCAYTASKFAARGLLQSVRAEIQKFGIKTGSVFPGGIDTPWWDEMHRGGRDPKSESVDKSNFLSTEDVVASIMTIVNQSSSSDIEEIVIEAPKVEFRKDESSKSRL